MFEDSSGSTDARQRRRWLVGMLSLTVNQLVIGASAGLAGSKEAGAATSAPAPQVELVYLANRQRGLIQRIAKLYAQSLMGVRASDAKRVLGDSVSRFEVLHEAQIAAQQRSGSENYQIESTLKRVTTDWARFRALVTSTPSAKNLPDIAAQCDGLSSRVNQSAGPTALFLSNSRIGQLVDYSGKQCLLSQQMAKCYFFRALNHQRDECARQIAEARREFAENAILLSKAPENSGEIKSLLLLASTQWPYFEEAVTKVERNDSSQFDYNVATTAENMYEVLERINQLYYKTM